MKIIEYFKELVVGKEVPQIDLDGDGYFDTVEEVISFIKKEFKRRQEDRRPYELQWSLNMNFLNNNQFCDINLTLGEVMQTAKDYEWEVREPHNQIAPIFETRLAKLSKVRPAPFVIPADSSVKAESTAKISKCILEGLDKDQDMNKKRSIATAWSELCGCCFIGTRWDQNKGRALFYDGPGNIIHEGEIEKDIITPFEIFPDSSFSQGIKGCKSIIRAKSMHVNDIYDIWGKKIPGRDIDVFTLDQTNIGIGGFNRNSVTTQFKPTIVEKSEIVIEYMELPNRRRPEGLHIILAGNELLYYGEYVYKVGINNEYGFPIVMQVCSETPGRFWPTSIIERLIPIQRNYNDLKNKKKEIFVRDAIGNWAVEDDGNIDVEDLEREGMYPGKIHLYSRGGTPPKQITGNANTASYDAEETKLLNEFVTISGVSTFASQSATPTGQTSGMALEKIKESDDTRMGLAADNINMAAIESYKIDLRVYRQFVKTPRLSRYVDPNNLVQWIEWLSSDLTSDDIIIEKTDELSQSPAQRKQMILDLLQYKLFSNDVDPRIRSKVIELLQLGNWEDADTLEDLNKNKALRENMLTKQGTVLQVKDFDMHVIHIQEHDRWRLDVDFEEFERINPELAQQFNDHVNQHQAYLQQSQMQTMQLQQAQA